MSSDLSTTDIIALTADIVSAHVGNNDVPVTDLPAFIVAVHAALVALDAPEPLPAPAQEPAVPIRSSVKADYIVSLESGRKLKMLKRYLLTSYGMTPDDYRRKWDLPSDYPMVAPNYAMQRKELAHRIGLGHKRPVAALSGARATARSRKGQRLAEAAE